VRNFYSVDHRAIYLDSGLVYKVVSSHCCLLILQSNTEIWFNAPNYFTARKLKGINMKKILAVSLVAIMLMGCGSGDKNNPEDQNIDLAEQDIDPEDQNIALVEQDIDPDEQNIGLDIDLSQFKSTKQLIVAIEGGEVSNGAEIGLNEFVTGSLGATPVISFSYWNTTDALLPVMVSLSSPADNLDLAVTDDFKLEDDSYKDDSNELLVFQAKSDTESVIYIESLNDDNAEGKAFTLTLVEASREGLGLSADEYGVNLDESSIEDCDDTALDYEYEGISVTIFNFKDGYMRSASGDFRFDFTGANGNTLTGVYADAGINEHGPYNYSVLFSYTVNSDTGALTGSRVSDSSYTDVDEDTGTSAVVTCNSNSNYDGNIIL
jgi:hypothetical protein